MNLQDLMAQELTPSMDAVVMASGELFVLEYQLTGVWGFFASRR